jgi:hypothetical protein
VGKLNPASGDAILFETLSMYLTTSVIAYETKKENRESQHETDAPYLE